MRSFCAYNCGPFDKVRSRMRVYRLDPIYLDDPCWQASSVTEPVWVAAATAARARQLVAEQTSPQAGWNPGARPNASPWLSDILTSCVLEPWPTDASAGTLMVAGDPRIAPAMVAR
jgi:hypothetical protein